MTKKFENEERNQFDQLVLKEIQEKNKLKPLTDGQADFIDAIDENIYVLCNGPAGTGKTHISIAKGLEYLRENKVKKILLIRPTVTCGDDLGFMPGDKNDKISPYMDAFHELFSKLLTQSEFSKLILEQKLEINVSQFKRGCTFDNTYVIVDESQNYKKAQLKMLLTRLGVNGKMVFVGDFNQSDLPQRDMIGFMTPYEHMVDHLKDLDRKIEYVQLDERDIVRGDDEISKLIRKINSRYVSPQTRYN